MPPGGVVFNRANLTFEKKRPSALAGVAQNNPQVTKKMVMVSLRKDLMT